LLADAIASVPRVAQQPLAPRSLTKLELRRLLKEVDIRASKRDKAIVYLFLYSGLRLGEVAQLHCEDISISPRSGTLKVRAEWAKAGKERAVPLAATARATLNEYLEGRGAGPLFTGERGPLGRNGLTRVVLKYAAAAGVKLSPHRLRHSFAYRYLEQTKNDLVGLAAILGHSNLNTTMGYTRKRLDDLQDAVEHLEFL
jgi:integrase